MWSLEQLANTVHEWLNETFPSTWAMLIEFVIVGVCIIGLFAMLGLVLIMMERKVSSWMQLRLGPNRVGPGGMFQTVADTLKLIVKEGMTPNGVDKLLFNVAPFVVMIIAMVIMAPLILPKAYRSGILISAFFLSLLYRRFR